MGKVVCLLIHTAIDRLRRHSRGAIGPVVITGVVVVAQGAVLIYWAFRDRRFRSAQREARRLHSADTHAGRLALVGEIAGSIAHEISQPLSAILTNADAAEKPARRAAAAAGRNPPHARRYPARRFAGQRYRAPFAFSAEASRTTDHDARPERGRRDRIEPDSARRAQTTGHGAQLPRRSSYRRSGAMPSTWSRCC